MIFICVWYVLCVHVVLYLLVWVCAQNYLGIHGSWLMVSVSEIRWDLNICLKFPGTDCCATPDLENYTLGSGGAAVRTTFKGTARGRRKPRQWDALLFLQLFCQPQDPRILKLPSVSYVISHSQPDCRAKVCYVTVGVSGTHCISQSD